MSEQKPGPEDLLGGYATGTLSTEERKRLFEAALKDQALFNALAEDEVLRQLLEDAKVRKRLLSALPDPKRRVVPLWRRPAVLGAAAGLLMVMATVVQLRKYPRSAVPGRVPLKGDATSLSPSATPGALAKPQIAAPPVAPASPKVAAKASELMTQADLKVAPVAAGMAPPPPAPSVAMAEEAPKPLAAPTLNALKEREVVGAEAKAGAGASPSVAMGSVAKDEAMEGVKAKKSTRAAEAPAGPPLRACHVEKLEGGRYRILVIRSQGTHLYVVERRGPANLWLLPIQEIQRADGTLESRLEFEAAPGEAVDVYALNRAVAKPPTLGEEPSGQWKRVTLP